MPAESPPSHSAPRFCCALLLLLAAFGINFHYSTQGWENPVLDTHGFRQTQTALSAYWIERGGFALDYPTPVLGAPWTIPFEFPLYQSLVAATAKVSGAGIDQCGRGVALGFFYLSLVPLVLLVRGLRHPWDEALLFAALLLVTPVLLFYSRTVLIESTAFATSCWFLWLLQMALNHRNVVWVILAMLIGAAAAMIKVPTLAIALVVGVALTLAAFRNNSGRRLAVALRFTIVSGFSILMGVAWTHYTDVVKSRSVLGVTQTTEALQQWNFGTAEQRLSTDFWWQLARFVERTSLPLASLGLILLLLCVGPSRPWWRMILLLIFAAVGPLVFANLYFVHDYYFYAIAAFLVGVLALLLREVWISEKISLPARCVVIVIALAAQLSGYQRHYLDAQLNANRAPPDIALALKAATQPDDVLLGLGLHWSSVIPYYSERRAIMVPEERLDNAAAIAQAIAETGADNIAAVVVRRSADPHGERFKSLREELGMDPVMMFATGDVAVFVRRENAVFAIESFLALNKPGLYLYEGQAESRLHPAPSATTYEASDLKPDELFAGFSPLPRRVITPFNLSAQPSPAGNAFSAHPPCAIEIEPPAGASQIELEFGIAEGAYADSDGVRFRVFLITPENWEVLLFERTLIPRGFFSDHGLQACTVKTTSPFNGYLKLVTDAGPAGQDSFDWAYWRRVEVK